MVQLIRTLWDTAVDNNLNLVRFFAFAVSPEYALQPSPGQYSEAIFKGLDYALEQLRMRGLKVRAAARIMLLHDSTWCLFRRCGSKVLAVSLQSRSALRHFISHGLLTHAALDETEGVACQMSQKRPCARKRQAWRACCGLAQAILAITDNWQAVGGADQYVKWCGGSGHSDFFSNGNCMQLYKNFANTLINRVNTVNGRVCAPGPWVSDVQHIILA